MSAPQFHLDFRKNYAILLLMNETTKADFIKMRIMNSEGLILRWPKKQKDKELVIEYISSSFEVDVKYSEAEVNEIIQKHIAFYDYALIRRELFDRGYLNRTADCKEYWLNKKANGEI